MIKQRLCYLLTAIPVMEQTPTKPNVIVVLTDDMGWADLGVQGVEKDLKTPHSDALAAAGEKEFNVKLSNAISGAPDFHPICETKWSHDPRSRMAMFVDGGAQKNTPQIAGFEDFRSTTQPRNPNCRSRVSPGRMISRLIWHRFLTLAMWNSGLLY